ncbi:uncharacterized protein LOC121048810 [Rosa chinensis]|uniref:uncharacterized protein LOC121048810 n=1 Tax=Rosa chinensis TaxID=74649 RepID=UPI000D08FF53|nr:uncharacterized protein LOC121048810 [Rosa chinensis]
MDPVLSLQWEYKKTKEKMRFVATAFVAILFGFFLGVSFPTISLTKMNFPPSHFSSIDISYIEEKYSGFSTQALVNAWSSLKSNRDISVKYIPNDAKVWSDASLVLCYVITFLVLMVILSRLVVTEEDCGSSL